MTQPGAAARRPAAVRIALVLLVVLLAACGEPASSRSGGDPEGDWVFARGSVDGQDVPISEEVPITLTIDGSSIGGTVCNSFGGRIIVSGGRVEIVDLVGTQMACVDEDVMTAETLVMTGLGMADSVTVEDGDLVIRGPDVELRYVAAGAAGAAAAASEAPGEPLEGSWQLTSATVDGAEIPILEDHPVTLTFRGAEIGGIAACNRYGALITVIDGVMRISQVGGTQMACVPAAMAVEAAYLGALQGVTAIERRGAELAASGDGVELRYVALPPPPTAELVDTVWILETVVIGEVAAAPVGDPATLEFRSDGTFSGSTGCRTFEGRRWVESGERIDTPEWGLEGECPPNLSEQDSQVVSVIGDGFTPTVDGDRLTLSDPSGEALVYRAGD